MIGAGNKVAINKNMQFFQPETQEKQRLDKKVSKFGFLKNKINDFV